MQLDYSNTHIGKSIRLEENDVKLALAEIGPLRDEVNRTVDRLSTNETVCGGAIFALIGSQWALGKPNEHFDYLLYWSLPILACLVAMYGKWRADTFRRHMSMVDIYLKDMERQFSSSFGWTNFYEDVVTKTEIPRQAGTRDVFWHVLRFTSFACLVMTARIYLD